MIKKEKIEMRRKCLPFLPACDAAEDDEVLGTTKAIMQP